MRSEISSWFTSTADVYNILQISVQSLNEKLTDLVKEIEQHFIVAATKYLHTEFDEDRFYQMRSDQVEETPSDLDGEFDKFWDTFDRKFVGRESANSEFRFQRWKIGERDWEYFRVELEILREHISYADLVNAWDEFVVGLYNHQYQPHMQPMFEAVAPFIQANFPDFMKPAGERPFEFGDHIEVYRQEVRVHHENAKYPSGAGLGHGRGRSLQSGARAADRSLEAWIIKRDDIDDDGTGFRLWYDYEADLSYAKVETKPMSEFLAQQEDDEEGGEEDEVDIGVSVDDMHRDEGEDGDEGGEEGENEGEQEDEVDDGGEGGEDDPNAEVD